MNQKLNIFWTLYKIGQLKFLNISVRLAELIIKT